jgi:hypothetical protein
MLSWSQTNMSIKVFCRHHPQAFARAMPNRSMPTFPEPSALWNPWRGFSGASKGTDSFN